MTVFLDLNTTVFASFVSWNASVEFFGVSLFHNAVAYKNVLQL